MSRVDLKEMAAVALAKIEDAAEWCDEIDCDQGRAALGEEVTQEFAGAVEALRALKRELAETMKAVQEAAKAADGLAEALEENGEEGETE